MATYNFTTSGSNWSIIVDGDNKGTWPRSAGHGILAQNYIIDPTSSAIVVSILSQPYYSAKIRATDTVQINGVNKTGSLTEKAIAVESEVTIRTETGTGGTTTLQQAIDAGSLLTKPNVIDIGNNSLRIHGYSDAYSFVHFDGTETSNYFDVYVSQLDNPVAHELNLYPDDSNGAAYIAATNADTGDERYLYISPTSVYINDGASNKSVAAISGADNYADDAAAAVGGIPVGGFYHTAGTVKIRLV